MKTGLVVEGGGMKCAYSSGVLDVFLENDINFDYVNGVSAGSACAASYVAGQRERNRRFYSIHSMSKKYASLDNLIRTGSFFGLDYIYSTLTNEDGADPLDYDAMEANPCEFEVVVTDAMTGHAAYFNKKDMKRNDYAAIKASCALPVMSNPQLVDGREYFDGGVSDSLPIQRAWEKGVRKAVVIFSKPEGYLMQPQKHRVIFTFALRKYPAVIYRLRHRHEFYNRQITKIRQMRDQGKVITFSPSADIKVSTYKVDQDIMEELYQNGREDAERRVDELKEFLSVK